LTDAIGMLDAGPVVIRYPKGTARNVDDADVGSGVKARKLVSPSNAKACILAVGNPQQQLEAGLEEVHPGS